MVKVFISSYIRTEFNFSVLTAKRFFTDSWWQNIKFNSINYLEKLWDFKQQNYIKYIHLLKIHAGHFLAARQTDFWMKIIKSEAENCYYLTKQYSVWRQKREFDFSDSLIVLINYLVPKFDVLKAFYCPRWCWLFPYKSNLRCWG